ncbi:hypothetical protein HB762_27455 (plasmid) [Vibrio campbellii]|uniref:DUF333 domain-containing protein n=1 Tax=Vibrio campbellii TaxID=680 RepID=A0ABY5IMB5_9VIBR|nr:hypothetical protein [Vibrio campbellii]UTZ34755.1 hypothetical protein HB762_26200 [Vibrio campbellii]UTZ35004.1 hypothetical protein HB762_27455 [Vibrio campbellii]
MANVSVRTFVTALVLLNLGCSDVTSKENSAVSDGHNDVKSILPVNTIKMGTVGPGRLSEVKCEKESDIGTVLLNDEGYPYFCVSNDGKVFWATPRMKELEVISAPS